MASFWRIKMWLHRVTGFLIMFFTIALGIIGISLADWHILSVDYHTLIGFIVLITAPLVFLNGLVT
jgi:hypothetical protein